MKYTKTISAAFIITGLSLGALGLQNAFANEFDFLDTSETMQNYISYSKSPELVSYIDTIIPETALFSEPETKENNVTDFNLRDEFFNLSIQEKSLSCESSATSDILSTLLGEDIHEDDVISKLPFGETYNELPTWKNGERFWGNPNEGFVGLIDGASQSDYTGYGVYEAPIADVYNQYGFETEIINAYTYEDGYTPELHLEYLLESMLEGEMVQLWGDWCTVNEFDNGTPNSCFDTLGDRSISWNYTDEDGNIVEHTGLNGEHAFILLGWKGETSNPSHIRIWDTDTGYHEYVTSEWMRKWDAMDYRSIVVTP